MKWSVVRAMERSHEWVQGRADTRRCEACADTGRSAARFCPGTLFGEQVLAPADPDELRALVRAEAEAVVDARAATQAAKLGRDMTEARTAKYPRVGRRADQPAVGSPVVLPREFWPMVTVDPVIDAMYRAHGWHLDRLPATALEFLDCVREICDGVRKRDDLQGQHPDRHLRVEVLDPEHGQAGAVGAEQGVNDALGAGGDPEVVGHGKDSSRCDEGVAAPGDRTVGVATDMVAGPVGTLGPAGPRTPRPLGETSDGAGKAPEAAVAPVGDLDPPGRRMPGPVPDAEVSGGDLGSGSDGWLVVEVRVTEAEIEAGQLTVAKALARDKPWPIGCERCGGPSALTVCQACKP